MKRRLATIATGALLITCALGASPALAATESGSLSCSRGATIGVRGEQQRLDRLEIRAGGGLIDWTNSSYTVSAVSGVTSGSWSASSYSLYFAGSYAWCNGDISR